MPDRGIKGLKRITAALGFSVKGLRAAWQHEAAFRQELMGTVVLVPLALWLGETGVERALLLMTLGMVLIAELVNSAIEATVDRFGGEIHPLSGRAKDIGSAVVLMSLLVLVVVWACVLLG